MASRGIRLVDGGQDLSSSVDRFIAKQVKAYLSTVDKLVNRFVINNSGREYNTEDYPGLAKLEQNWDMIREELDVLLEDVSDVIQYEAVDKRYARKAGNSTKTQIKDDWRIEQFYLYGKRIERGFARAPKTSNLLNSMSGVQTALFSILEPGAHIKPHRGEYSGALRCHLGLKVPSPRDCQLRVEKRIYHWEEATMFIFDHTDEHEAWNNSEQRRVVLIVDFVRKLPFPLSVLNIIGLKLLQISPHIRDAAEILEKGPSNQSATVTV